MGLAAEAIADKSQKWWHLSSIQLAGGLISIPVIATGSQLFMSYGLLNAILSILIGNFLVLIAGYAFICVSFHKRFNAVENAKQFIGNIPGKVLALFILVGALGWVALELQENLKILLKYSVFSKLSAGSLIGAIACLILLRGMKGIKLLCIYSVIPLFLLLSYILLRSNPNLPIQDDFAKIPSIFSLAAISVAMSPSIAAVIDYPTFFRHSKTKKDALITLGIIFSVTSILQGCGILLFNYFLESGKMFEDLLRSPYLIDSICAIGFTILSLLGSIAWNVYAASVGWESLFPIFKDRTQYAVIGLVVITLFSSLGIESFFASLPTQIDAIVSSIGGVILACFLERQFQWRQTFDKLSIKVRNTFSWFAASAAALAAGTSLAILQIDSPLSGFLIGFLISIFFALVQRLISYTSR
jgi:cytosine permease